MAEPEVWPRLVTCPLTRRLSGKHVPCGDLRAIGWRPIGPPAYYVCTHCLTKWPTEHVRSLIKARARVAKPTEPEPHTEPMLPGMGDQE